MVARLWAIMRATVATLRHPAMAAVIRGGGRLPQEHQKQQNGAEKRDALQKWMAHYTYHKFNLYIWIEKSKKMLRLN